MFESRASSDDLVSDLFRLKPFVLELSHPCNNSEIKIGHIGVALALEARTPRPLRPRL